MIYLDNAATTKMLPEVLEEMMPFMTDSFGNAGSLYSLGIESKMAIEKARERVANFMGAESPENIIFTSGGTESNNMVVNSYRYSGSLLVSSGIEHDSILNSIKRITDDYPSSQAAKVEFIKTNRDGVVDIEDFKRIVSCREVRFATVMQMNNETGVIQPVQDIYNICDDMGIFFHTDCVQAAGCMKLDVKSYCDYASISSHKIHGPKGVGALYIKNKYTCDPLIIGGSNQEFGFRGGTENVAGIVGFGKACELANDESAFDVIKRLKNIAWEMLTDSFNRYGIGDRIHLNCNNLDSFGKTINIMIDGIDAETLVMMLGAIGVFISAGSACRSLEQEPSHVLTNIGLTPDEARSSIRISVSEYNSRAELKEAADGVARVCSNILCM